MAGKAGTGGLVQYKGVPVFNINTWSVDVNSNMLDVTSWTTGTDQWRSFTPGLNDVAGSFAGFWSPATSTAQADLRDNILTPATGTLLLEDDKTGGGKWSVDSYLSQLSVSANIDGVNEVTFSFQGTGAPTYSTTT